jgi:hypothetical protein
MKPPPTDYQKTEQALNRIITAEINDRLAVRKRLPHPAEVSATLERVNREIVQAHQSGSLFDKLPRLFQVSLQLNRDGRLHLDSQNTPPAEYRHYMAKKRRFDALMAASLFGLRNTALKSLVNMKSERFERARQKAVQVMEWVKEAREIRESLPKRRFIKPRDEEEAVALLKEMSAHRARLEELKSRYAVFEGDKGLENALAKLRHALNQAARAIDQQSKRSVKFILGQAGVIFKMYQSTPADIANIDTFISQKDELKRYRNLFDALGDRERRDQVAGYMETVDATVQRLQKKIDARKRVEALQSDKEAQAIDAVYTEFLEIKERYAQGRVASRKERKRALAHLRKTIDVLKANGQRIRAREIERFINATDLSTESPSGMSTGDATLRSAYLFYRKAFFILLPLSVGLAALSGYLAIRLLGFI